MDTARFSRLRAFTYISIAALICLSLPLAADAATGSSTNIVDPVHPSYKARVNSAGQLSVKVANTVPVTGTVNVGNVGPNQPYNGSCNTEQPSGGEAACLLHVPAGKRLAITTVTLRCGALSATSGGVPGWLSGLYGVSSSTEWDVPLQPEGKDFSGWYDFIGSLQGPIYVGNPAYGLDLHCSGNQNQTGGGTLLIGTVSGYLY